MTLAGILFGMARFLAQHHDTKGFAGDSDWTEVFATLAEAQMACERTWGEHVTSARQEISRVESGERWFRTDGNQIWLYVEPSDDRIST